MVSILAKALG